MPDEDDVYERWRIGDYVPRCARIVLRQRDRVLGESEVDAHEMEMHLYVIALAHLRDIVAWAWQGASSRAQETGAESKAAMKEGDTERAAALLAESKAFGQRDSAIAKAVAVFDAAAPDVKNVRDIHEHIEAYERGVGEIQLERLAAGAYREYGDVVPELSIWWDGGTVHVMGFEVNASTSAPAAEQLATAVVAALK